MSDNVIVSPLSMKYFEIFPRPLPISSILSYAYGHIAEYIHLLKAWALDKTFSASYPVFSRGLNDYLFSGKQIIFNYTIKSTETVCKIYFFPFCKTSSLV